MAQKGRRPVAAMVVSMVAGIEIIIVSFILAVIGAGLSRMQGGVGAIFGIIGIAWGIMIIASAFMMYLTRERHVLWGALIIVFSIASIFGAIGGIFLGLILGVIGGILGIVWSPQGKSGGTAAS